MVLWYLSIYLSLSQSISNCSRQKALLFTREINSAKRGGVNMTRWAEIGIHELEKGNRWCFYSLLHNNCVIYIAFQMHMATHLHGSSRQEYE